MTGRTLTTEKRLKYIVQSPGTRHTKLALKLHPESKQYFCLFCFAPSFSVIFPAAYKYLPWPSPSLLLLFLLSSLGARHGPWRAPITSPVRRGCIHPIPLSLRHADQHAHPRLAAQAGVPPEAPELFMDGRGAVDSPYEPGRHGSWHPLASRREGSHRAFV